MAGSTKIGKYTVGTVFDIYSPTMIYIHLQCECDFIPVETDCFISSISQAMQEHEKWCRLNT